jgi:hypothetical protein
MKALAITAVAGNNSSWRWNMLDSTRKYGKILVTTW